MSELFNLAGHGAVVTGGNGGIGLGIARALAKSGANVVVWGRNEQKNDAALEDLMTFGTDVEAVICDVTDEDSVADAMERSVGLLGRVDSCFANAGTGPTPTPFEKLSLQEWSRVQRGNLDGTFLTLRAAANRMIESGEGGSLVATSSLTAIEGAPRSSAYGAAKGAIGPLIKTLAVELARKGIRANAIMPGWIDTDLTHQTFEDERFSGAVMPRIPARRWGKPADIGAAAVYLASPSSSYHTGDVLKIDGAYSIC